MQSRAWIAFVLVAIGACVGDDPAGSGSSSGQPSADGGSSSGGGSSGTPLPPPPPGCVGTVEPSRDACVLHENFGVFVSSTGSDQGAGTREAPFATLGHALAAAQAAGKRVYICAGAYAEGTVQLRSGVSIYGGLACDQSLWTVSPTARVVLRTTASPAIRAKDIATDTTVEGIDVIAPDGAEPGASSIGLIAENAIGLRFVRSSISAGIGADGPDAVEPPPLVAGWEDPGDSTEPRNAPAGPPKVPAGGRSACTMGGSLAPVQGHPGGAGGYTTEFVFGPSGIVTQGQAFSGLAQPATGETARGGNANPPTKAQSGEPARDGSNGRNGTTFTLSPEGYAGENGAKGSDGQPGQGGGGGAPTAPDSTPPQIGTVRRLGGFGAGGGSGGCPGIAGPAGDAGGASISVLSFASLIDFQSTLFSGARGGAGGRGAVGNAPTAGNPPGACVDRSFQCGGSGADGGKSGWSGHGLSGASIGIAYMGTEPTRSEDSVITVAAAREGQPELTGNGKTIPAGAPGTSAEIFVIPVNP